MTRLACSVVIGLTVAATACGKGRVEPTVDTNDGAASAGAPTVGTAHGADAVRIVTEGQAQELSAEDSASVAEMMERLFASATSRLRTMIEPEDWDEAVARGTCIEVQYADPKSLSTQARDPVTATALLLPLRDDGSEPELWARDGETIYSPFIQFDPLLHQELRDRARQ